MGLMADDLSECGSGGRVCRMASSSGSGAALDARWEKAKEKSNYRNMVEYLTVYQDYIIDHHSAPFETPQVSALNPRVALFRQSSGFPPLSRPDGILPKVSSFRQERSCTKS
jgi:hypothetical protein